MEISGTPFTLFEDSLTSHDTILGRIEFLNVGPALLPATGIQAGFSQ
jgi:hypothetical protein